jgi:ribonucleoside-triphosphate reductase
MRTFEEVEKELGETRDALSHVQGNVAEVYSRIVGYYRSVRNWNKGKREEYGERKLYDVKASLAGESCGNKTGIQLVKANAEAVAAASAAVTTVNTAAVASANAGAVGTTNDNINRLLLFVRKSCPQCPSAKTAASKLGIPVETVDAATELGIAEATRWTVMSTPTAILLSKDGKEISRAQDSLAISRLLVERQAA